MTHKQLVERAARWLRNSKRCPVVLRELATAAGEIPDVIGFWVGGNSMLIECKVSRADFLADKEKVFRYCGDRGMGDRRYFAAPHGLLTIEEIPEAWGLIEVHDHFIKIAKEAYHFPEINKRSEITMLVSAMRRLEIATAVFIRQEEPPGSPLATTQHAISVSDESK